MDELDRALARLAGAPAPAALDGIEARVLARIDAHPTARAELHIGVVMLTALAVGVLGAGIPGADAGSQFAPLGGSSPLAPSTLLIGNP